MRIVGSGKLIIIVSKNFTDNYMEAHMLRVKNGIGVAIKSSLVVQHTV